MIDHPTFQGTIAATLVTSHFWADAIQIVSTTATLIATMTGAIIGVVTVYRMFKQGRK